MKICVIGVAGIPEGKHNIKDPRLDKAHELVEAKKKTYAQVDVVGEDGAIDADVILVARDRLIDVLLKDLEFIETRLSRDPAVEEQAVLLKLQAHLEGEQPVCTAGLSEAEWQALTGHGFVTSKPVVLAEPDEIGDPEALMVRAFHGSGYICFLTVGGPENRAWPIRHGLTAAEAAGSIHTELQKGFIRAEVIGFDDFVAAGGEKQAKHAGKQRLEMKAYVVQDYDLMNIRANK
jgi:ribosome-binding ATPase YchF (GTP1/OBG family)